MLTGSITFEGKTQTDIENAVEEALRLIKNGNYSGTNSNEDGEFSFEVSGEEEREEEQEEIEHFYDVHVQINRKTGYSIPIKISSVDKLSDDEVIAQCVKQNLFSESGDEEFVDSVDEIEEEEYNAMKNI